jgi:hypothetical protein
MWSDLTDILFSIAFLALRGVAIAKEARVSLGVLGATSPSGFPPPPGWHCKSVKERDRCLCKLPRLGSLPNRAS